MVAPVDYGAPPCRQHTTGGAWRANGPQQAVGSDSSSERPGAHSAVLPALFRHSTRWNETRLAQLHWLCFDAVTLAYDTAARISTSQSSLKNYLSGRLLAAGRSNALNNETTHAIHSGSAESNVASRWSCLVVSAYMSTHLQYDKERRNAPEQLRREKNERDCQSAWRCRACYSTVTTEQIAALCGASTCPTVGVTPRCRSDRMALRECYNVFPPKAVSGRLATASAHMAG